MSGRPQSRGMGGGRGPMAGIGPLPGGMTPGGAGMGQPMGGTFRPQTGAQWGAAPGTAANRGASRMGTAARMSSSLNTEVKVADRPLTQMGVKGMKTGASGPGRQIYDKTYYMSQLRQRIDELKGALQAFNKEITEISNDNQLYSSYEKRYDTLIKTVRTYEGDLADYNLALDKQRTDTRPEEVQYMYALLKNQNDTQRQEMDAIFLEKKSHEEQIKHIEEELLDIEKQNEDLLNELHPDQLEEYTNSQEENRRMAVDITDMKMNYEELSMRLQQQENRLRSEPLRGRKIEISEQKQRLQESISVLEEEANTASMPIPEQRDMLLAKVKSDNAEIVASEKYISDVKMDIEKYKKLLSEMQTDIEEKKGESNDQQKYEILFTKDQEMSSFIEGFDEAKAGEQERIKSRQQNIVQLLESISRCTAQDAVNPEEKAQDMEDELKFKNRQLQNSASTQTRLEGELEKRQSELDKINSLDTKISTELQQLEAKIVEYQDEMSNKLDFVDKMKKEKEAQINQLKKRRSQLEERAQALKKQVNFLQIRYDGKKQQLLENETHADLDAQEQKMKQYEQNLFHLKTFIAAKTSETDFQRELAKVMERAEQVNQIIQKQLTQRIPAY